jgi:hypothetical protein
MIAAGRHLSPTGATGGSSNRGGDQGGETGEATAIVSR